MAGKTLIIAEAGVNHNGSLNMALQLVEQAHEAGADLVKFQTFKADKLLTKQTEKAAYQKVTTGHQETQYEMIKRLELSEADHLVIRDHCRRLGIGFLSTPFDIESLHFLVEQCDIDCIKIPSGEITNAPLLLAAAQTGKPIILSTGMSILGEVERALSVIAYGYTSPSMPPGLASFECAYASRAGQESLSKNVTLLHCTTEYPAPLDEVNLRAMDTMGAAFGLCVGYSDHTKGITIPIAAVARGAVVIEKHFTLDRTLPGPDHASSLEPHEFKAMVEAIRDVERSLGYLVKLPGVKEMANRAVVRKCIVASRPIKRGEPFTADNLTVKRAGAGISPMEFWELIGQVADRDYEPDQVIER
jgi:N-acetylneuraminate synthase